MKTIKTVKVKATKTGTKVSATKTPAVVRARKDTVPATVGALNATTSMASIEPAPAAPRGEITPDLIAARAYTIWEQQGRPHGKDVANWLLAESQLRQEIQSFTA